MEAKSAYKKAILHNKNFPEGYYNIGNLYREMGEFSQQLKNTKALMLRQTTLKL